LLLFRSALSAASTALKSLASLLPQWALARKTFVWGLSAPDAERQAVKEMVARC